MINDQRPYFIKKISNQLELWYSNHFVAPHFEQLGPGHHMMKPWNIRVHGKHIRAGNNIHIVTAVDRKVSLSTWTFAEHQGEINLGNNVLLCPGVRLDSASEIRVGDNCMFAAGAYVTDADWHDVYDRTQAVGNTRPVELKDNVWIGDGATVCKGVTIGENSVIGAGSVVTGDIPDNVIAAGNPARVVKSLDPDRQLVTRESIFSQRDQMDAEMIKIDQYVLHHNNFFNWLRSLVAPKRGD